MGYEQEIIKVRFDKQMLKEFCGYDVDDDGESYYKAHPRAKKPPYDNIWKKNRYGLLPSTNVFLNCHDRRIQNDIKQHIGDYTTYCLKRQNIPSAYFDEFVILCVQYKPTKANSDNDNTWVKSSLDAMTKYDMWDDDNYLHMRFYQSFSVVDKNDPRTEIVIFPIFRGEYEFDYVIRYAAEYVARLEKQYEEI